MKKLIASLMALAMVFSFVACGGKDEEATTVATTTGTTMAEDAIDEGMDKFLGGEEAEDTEETTAVVEVTDESGEAVTNEDGEAVTETVTKKPSDNKKPNNDKKPTTTKKQEIDPATWSQADVLEFYKLATSKVVSAKPGYTKSRSTDISNNDYSAGPALTAFKSVVFGFLGVGAENKFEEKVAKGTNTNDDKCGDYLRASTLTTSDITSAKATKSGNTITITIGIKAGSSQIEEGNNAKNNSPINKTGICDGLTDRSGFDHKSAPLCYAAIGGTIKKTSIYEKTNNGKVVATVNATTGELQKLVITWNASADIDTNLGDGTIKNSTTTVTYANFGW